MVLDRYQTDLYVRPSWLDAAVALHQIEKGKAEGRRSALWFRSLVQKQLFQLGSFLRRSAVLVLLVAVILLGLSCVGLKSAIIHSRVDQLWIEEGGRLEGELKYIESILEERAISTHQLVIQTPKDPLASLLHSEALLAHLKVIKAALSVTVHVFNVPWRLKDICYTPSFTSFEMLYIDQIFHHVIPCTIITPLDCFWEGSKLLGPDTPVTLPGLSHNLKWTNLNPEHLVQVAKSLSTNFPFRRLEDIMKRAGITTGYQRKPCLNPKDKECPNTAPNKNSSQRLDIGAELTGGCSGFASKYMHSPEGLIVGGAKKNKTGHITKAHGLQSVIALMGEKELFDYYKDDYKVQQIYWSAQKAAVVLESWKRKFAEEVNRQMKMSNEETIHYNVYPFSTDQLNDILSHFSDVNFRNIIFGYLIMLIFVALSLFKWNNPILSQTAVGVVGVLLISLTNAAALGICAVFGIPFNTSTTHVLPYLGLGMGVVNMFLLTNAYAQPSAESRLEEQTGVVLKKGGLSVLLTSLCNVGAFMSAAVIPIPALRSFALQAAVLVVFNLVTSLIVLPTVIKIDLSRRNSGRVDIFCCCCVMPGDGTWPCIEGSPQIQRKHKQKEPVSGSSTPDRQPSVTVFTSCGLNKSENPHLRLLPMDMEFGSGIPPHPKRWSRDSLLQRYTQFLCKKSVKVLTVILFLLTIVASVWNITRLAEGLDLSDIVPQNTKEHSFLNAQERYFGFYNMYAITRDNFEYPKNQHLLYEYHSAFTRVPNIVKNDNGGLPPFWLGMFRDWLLALQKAFDRDWAEGSITQEQWSQNATEEGILAYKLMVQTGHADKPVDKSQIPATRLVDGDGLINEDAFYNYLSAWVCSDALAYSASQGNLKPEPIQWCHAANDFQLEIPKALPLVYTQIPFDLQGLTSTSRVTAVISQVHELCERFEERGLPNFASGIPFLFWEDYQQLRQNVGLGVLCAVAVVFCVVFLLLLNVWAASIVTLSGVIMEVQVLGSFSVVGIKLSAVSAVLLIVAVGINMHYVAHTCLSFLTAIGNRERRLELAVKHMLPVVVQGALAMVLAVSMLLISDFDFIIRYFFRMLLIVNGVGFINGVLFFPMLLLLIGPPAEVKPLRYPDRICTPSPEPVRKSRRTSSNRQASVPAPSRRHRHPSLSTITEEQGSWADSITHEIIVEPQLIVETTTFTQPPPPGVPWPDNISTIENESSSNSSPASVHRVTTNPGCTSTSTSSSSVNQAGHVTTKVTATAKFKVEVHTPIHGPFERSNSHRYSGRRRDSTSSTSTTSTECSMKY